MTLPRILAAALLIACVLAVFSPALGNSPVWEDSLNLLENTGWRGFSPVWWFTSRAGGDFKPLVWVSYACDHLLWGLNPFGYHLAGILLHALSSLLLFVLILRLGEGSIPLPAAFFSALIWAVHPLRVESVVWITERKDTLFLFFYFLSILCYLRYAKGLSAASGGAICRGELYVSPAIEGTNIKFAPTKRHIKNPWTWYGATLGFGVLSLLSKPMAVSLPAVLLLLDYYPLRRFRRTAWRRLLAEKAPLILVSLAVAGLALRAQALKESLAPLEKLGLASRAALAGHTGVFYLLKTLFPIGLNPLYPARYDAPGFSPMGLLGLLFLLSVSALSYLSARKGKGWIVLAGGWYLLAWLPISGLFQAGLMASADRFSYLPAVGISIAISFFLSGVSRKEKKIWLPVAIIAVGGLGVLTFRQGFVWRNNLTLWNVGVKLGSAAAHYNLGNALKTEKDGAGAVTHYREALRIHPGYAEAHYNLAIALAEGGDPSEAIGHYREAIRLSPPALKARNNLGNDLAALGRAEEASREYEEILKIDPAHVEARNNLANLLAARGEYEAAIVHYRRVLEAAPDYADALYNLGVTLALTGKTAEAAECYRRVLAIDPGYEKARRNLGILFSEEK